MSMPHIMRPPTPPHAQLSPVRQDTAIVMCGGGDPFEEYITALELCKEADRTVTIFAGNDMIEKFPHDITHACSLHPDKFQLWLPRRRAAGFNEPQFVWAHRNYESSVTHWTRDWAGSTGLFCTKVAREMGFTHVVLCGVHMLVESNHFVRKVPWNNALGFRKGWNAHYRELQPYVRSMGGWTLEKFGAPTVEWLREDVAERHQQKNYNPGQSTAGLKA